MVSSFLQAPILSKLDRGGMLNGIEMRQPFLDQDVVEFSLRCPTSRLISREGTKLPLRTCAAPLLPRAVLERRKQGFRLPMRRLLRGPMRQLVHDTLSADRLGRHGLFDAARVQQLIAAHEEGREDWSKAIWSLLCFQWWRDMRISA
jgi:asparagine synthase (glutamine-hydrolysing)